MTFLLTILTLILVYYILKVLARMFAPYLIKKIIDKMQKKAAQQFTDQEQEGAVKTGETVIDKKPQNTKITNKNVGEYVDFEEVE